MNKRETSKVALVAIAGSAGGIEAMQEILSRLPADFPAPIMYLQHLSPFYVSQLVQALQPLTALKVSWAQQGDRPRAGVVYICPPACSFMTSSDTKIALIPMKTNHDRLHPANRFFSSVARSFTHRAVALVLSGAGLDGSEGVCAIQTNHGTVLAQDEHSCTVWGMSQAAIQTGCVDSVLALKNIAPMLINLAQAGKSSIDTLGGGLHEIYEQNTISILSCAVYFATPHNISYTLMSAGNS